MSLRDSINGFDPFATIQKKAAQDMTLFSLKAVIIIWSVFVILIALGVNNKWILAGILAYEVLP